MCVAAHFAKYSIELILEKHEGNGQSSFFRSKELLQQKSVKFGEKMCIVLYSQ